MLIIIKNITSRRKHINHKRTIITTIPSPINNDFSIWLIAMNSKRIRFDALQLF